MEGEINKFWYSAKHAAHLRKIGTGTTTIVIDGVRRTYTEATDVDKTAASCSVERGGVFDDYVFLGEASFETFEKHYLPGEAERYVYE